MSAGGVRGERGRESEEKARLESTGVSEKSVLTIIKVKRCDFRNCHFCLSSVRPELCPTTILAVPFKCRVDYPVRQLKKRASYWPSSG